MLAQRSNGRADASDTDLHGAMSLAHSLWSSGQRAAAARQYELIGNLLASRGQATLALSTFRMVASLAPYCRDTQLRCAEHYWAVGARTEAIAIWEWAATGLAAEGRPLDAAQILSRAVEAAPDDPDRRRRLAELYVAVAKYGAAVEHLHAAGVELLRRRRYPDFCATADRLLRLDPLHVPTLRARALVHLRRRDLPATFDALRRLLAASRGDAVAGELMVEVLVVAGRDRAAALAAELVAKVLMSPVMGDEASRAIARRIVARSRRRHPEAAIFVELESELATEVLDDEAIEVIEESLSVRPRAVSREAAWEKTGVFQLVAHAMRSSDEPDADTGVFELAS